MADKRKILVRLVKKNSEVTSIHLFVSEVEGRLIITRNGGFFVYRSITGSGDAVYHETSAPLDLS